jgi:hypothetical protein
MLRAVGDAGGASGGVHKSPCNLVGAHFSTRLRMGFVIAVPHRRMACNPRSHRSPTELNLFSSSRCYILSTTPHCPFSREIAYVITSSRMFVTLVPTTISPPMYYGRFFFPHPYCCIPRLFCLPYVHSYSPSVPISRLFGFGRWCPPYIETTSFCISAT